MGLPITAEEFRLIGQRFPSDDIVAEIDRLAPLGQADLPKLAEVEYTPAQLEALLGYRARLVAEDAGRRVGRGKKKGARRSEIDAVVEGKRLLRAGIDVAFRALATREPPAGEPPEETRRIADSFEGQIEALGGRIALDSALLRTRLTALASILEAAELAPRPEAQASRRKLLDDVRQSLRTLPTLAETKKGLQAEAKSDTAELDEIDGRAYWNLKQLCSAGRTYFRRQGDFARAAEYHLGRLTSRPRSSKPAPNAKA